ncbi:hypothetical protein [Rugosimonospora africana]|uniref:Uncharacterized protein n=1 Tax=Rugosimonospora africana TaxID=556532 RepID=A0A8J3VPB1_9ACTN|nr:hypothetical protein [Rugosimonospora africana]GIH13915.1 hypothetical protein Raf01_20870 [Rugosimonospora africana]
MDAPGTDGPDRTLEELRRVRIRSRRRAHGGAWLPAGVLAALVMVSAVLYRSPWHELTSGVVSYPYWAGLPSDQRSAPASYAYWLVGLPVAFAAIAWWYRGRSRRVGMRVPWPVFAGVGLAALLLIVVLLAVPRQPPTDPFLLTANPGPDWARGLATPLLAITASLVALGWVERSPALAVAGAWIGVLAWWQCAAGYGRIPGWLFWLLDGGQGPSLGGTVALQPAGMLLLMTLPLLACAVVAAARASRWRRSRAQ